MTSRDQDHSRTAGRVPPHNLDAEESVLGAALLSAPAADIVAGLLSADFYSPPNTQIFSAIRDLVTDDAPVDVVTVANELRRSGSLDAIGGMERLNALQNATPSVGATEHYARILRETSDRRRMIKFAAALTEAAFDEAADVVKALDAVQVDTAAMAARLAGETDRFATSSLVWGDPASVLEDGLEPEEPILLTRSDGAALFYAGKMHSLQAEPGTGKSWILIVAALEVIAMGGTVLFIDYEDTYRGIIRRCQEAGAKIDAAFLAALHYVEPEGGLGLVERAELFARVESLAPDLVIIDGVATSLTRAGLSEDDAADVTKWADLLPRPIARMGPCVVMNDHVVKSKEERGRYARGSGAKLAFLDGAAYNIVNRIPFSRHRAGASEMVVDKDRPGGVGAVKETVARIEFEPHAGGERLVITVNPHTEHMARSDTWRPTGIMEKLSRAIEDSVVPIPATTAKALVHAEKPAFIREAMARLLAEGFVGESGRPKMLHSLRPFRAASDSVVGSAPPDLPDDPPPPTLFVVPEWVDPDHQESLEHLSRDPDA